MPPIIKNVPIAMINELQMTAKDGNAAGDDVGDDGHGKGAAEPSRPVGKGVGGEMLGAS